MNYQERDSKNGQSRVRLAEVVALGVKQGHWTVTSKPYDPADPWRFVEVTTPAGLAFNLLGGSWNREGMISAHVGSIDKDGIRVTLNDAPGRLHGPTASASYTRSAETILKDLLRRVIASPEGIAAAEAVRATWNQRKASQGGLHAHMATLRGLGYTFNNVSPSESYSAKGYGRSGVEPYAVTVYAEGRVAFEAHADVSRFAAVLAVLNQGA